MEQIVLIAIFITILYCLLKFLEMKFVEKEMKPVKYIVRDAILVMFSSIIIQFVFSSLGNNVSEFFQIITNSKSIEPVAPTVFTDSPGF